MKVPKHYLMRHRTFFTHSAKKRLHELIGITVFTRTAVQSGDVHMLTELLIFNFCNDLQGKLDKLCFFRFIRHILRFDARLNYLKADILKAVSHQLH